MYIIILDGEVCKLLSFNGRADKNVVFINFVWYIRTSKINHSIKSKIVT